MERGTKTQAAASPPSHPRREFTNRRPSSGTQSKWKPKTEEQQGSYKKDKELYTPKYRDKDKEVVAKKPIGQPVEKSSGEGAKKSERREKGNNEKRNTRHEGKANGRTKEGHERLKGGRKPLDWYSIKKDIALKFFGLLEAKDLVNASRTCKSWHRSATHSRLWKSLCLETFPHKQPSEFDKLFKNKEGFNWHRAYSKAKEMGWDNPPEYEDFHVDEMRLFNVHSNNLLRGIYDHGFAKPSQIQAQAIPALVKGFDVIAQARSGTGKTAAFAIAAIARTDFSKKECQVLILAPNSHLAFQISKLINQLAILIDKEASCCLTEVSAVQEDNQKLRRGAFIAVGTPGRVNDLISRQVLKTTTLKMAIIDEADEMISRTEVGEIMQRLPKTTQNALFSTAISPAERHRFERFVDKPVRILISEEKLLLPTTNQFFIDVQEEQWKIDCLCDLYDSFTITQTIIFCNDATKAADVARELNRKSLKVLTVHEDLNEQQQAAIIDTFVSGEEKILVSTDKPLRGVDVPRVCLVINYDLPPSTTDYVRRVGASGRFGRKGVAIHMLTENDTELFKKLEEFYTANVKSGQLSHFSETIDSLPVDFLEVI